MDGKDDMKKMTILTLLFIISLLFGCKNQEIEEKSDYFSQSLVTLFVSNIDESVDWYASRMGFEIEKKIKDFPDHGMKVALLKYNEFHIEIIEKASSVIQSEFLPDNTYLGGLFKIGLRTNNITSLYNQLKQFDDIEFVTGIGELPESQLPIDWPTKYFLIKDPDGNFIQFFNSDRKYSLEPWLNMITVQDLDKSILWYVENLNFEHHETLGDFGNRRAVLSRMDCVVELFEPEHVVKTEIISVDTTVLGFRKMAFSIKNLNSFSAFCKEKNLEVIMPIGDSDLKWASKEMVIRDLGGNWIQMFELNE